MENVTDKNIPFALEILDQTWLAGSSAIEDLCSHGSIRLIIAGQTITNETADYGISESALALLRTLAHDHTPAQPLAERLIFHGCGSMLMSGCDIGINWSVHHQDGWIEITDVIRYDTNSVEGVLAFPQLRVRLPETTYRQVVIAFARHAQTFFEGIEKQTSSELYPGEYRAFWNEYHQLLATYAAQ
jgi:hypothetical protein